MHKHNGFISDYIKATILTLYVECIELWTLLSRWTQVGGLVRVWRIKSIELIIPSSFIYTVTLRLQLLVILANDAPTFLNAITEVCYMYFFQFMNVIRPNCTFYEMIYWHGSDCNRIKHIVYLDRSPKTFYLQSYTRSRSGPAKSK